MLPDDFTMLSHRRLANTGTRLSRDEFIASLSWGDDRGVRSEVRRDHLPRLCGRALVEVVTLHGTVDGGDFEQQFILVIGYDGHHLRTSEAFDLDQLDAALARYEELSTESPTAARIENAATRAVAHGQDAWEARDWERFAALFAPAFFHVDRRTLVQLELDRDQYLDSIRPFFEMATSAPTMDVLATRGNALVMVRAMVRVGRQDTGDWSGPSELEFIGVIEVDDGGNNIAMVQFDADDLDAAYAELDARYAAGEAAAYGSVATARQAFVQAVAARDWDALAAQFAPDLVVTDHRPFGWETLRGPAVFVETFKSLFDLAPDARLRTDHVTMSARGELVIATWWGTREGGAFEAPRVVVLEHDASGRICREDFYNLDQLDEARARFEALGASAARRSAAHPAERRDASERSVAGRMPRARTGTRSRRSVAPTLGVRRPSPLQRVAAAIATCSSPATAGWPRVGRAYARTVLATAGDRLALEHRRWTAAEDARCPSRSRPCRSSKSMPKAASAATSSSTPTIAAPRSVEMLDRYFRSDAARSTPRSVIEFVRAMNDHDLAGMRAALSGDFYFHDHRRTGVGRIGNADDYIASVAAVFEQSPDAGTETLYHVAVEPHGSLNVGRLFGTLVDGGEFESVFVRLGLYRGGRYVGTELFELEDLDVARARLRGAAPDPLRIPPNAATRASDRCEECARGAGSGRRRGHCARRRWCSTIAAAASSSLAIARRSSPAIA